MFNPGEEVRCIREDGARPGRRRGAAAIARPHLKVGEVYVIDRETRFGVKLVGLPLYYAPNRFELVAQDAPAPAPIPAVAEAAPVPLADGGPIQRDDAVAGLRMVCVRPDVDHLVKGKEYILRRFDGEYASVEGIEVGFFLNRFHHVAKDAPAIIPPAAKPVEPVFAVGDKVVIARPQLEGYAAGAVDEMAEYVGTGAVLVIKNIATVPRGQYATLEHVNGEYQPWSWDLRTLGLAAQWQPAVAPHAAPVPAPFGPGAKVRCIEGLDHKMRRGQEYTIQTVSFNYNGTKLYELQGLPGRKYRANRFISVDDAVAAPVKPAEGLYKEIGPFNKGDKVKILQNSEEGSPWDADGKMEGIMRAGAIHEVERVWGTNVCLCHCHYIWHVSDLTKPLPEDKRLAKLAAMPNLLEKLSKAEHNEWQGSLVSFATRALSGHDNVETCGPCYADCTGNRLQEIVIGTRPMVAQVRDGGKKGEGLPNFLRYFDWLLKDSPWSSCYMPTTVDEAIEKGGFYLNTDKPIGQIVGAAVAARCGHEHYARMPTFIHFLDKGYSGRVAFLMSLVVKLDGEQFILTIQAGGHDCIASNLSYDAIIDFFANGFKEIGEKPCKEQSGRYEIFRMIDPDYSGGGYSAKRGTQFGEVAHQRIEKEVKGEGFEQMRLPITKSVYELADYFTTTFKEQAK